MAFSDKKKKFVQEYLIDFNAAAAARRAGYSEKASNRKGYALLAEPEVQEYLTSQMAEIVDRNKVEIDSIVAELKEVAFSDMANYFDLKDEIKSIHDIDPVARRAVLQYEKETFEINGGKKITRKIKLHSKLDAIDKLMRYLGGYEKDNVPQVPICVNWGLTEVDGQSDEFD